MRTVLLHLHLEVPEDDHRPHLEILTAVRGALEVGWDDESVASLKPTLYFSGEFVWLNQGKLDLEEGVDP